MPDNSKPPVLPGYDFIRLLGTGSTASVYLYHQLVPERNVAVKVSKSPLDAPAAERFRNEANFMAQVSAHPYILSVHGAGITTNGLGYIVLEFAPGGSYKDLIRMGPLSADQMLDLGIKLASALETAHRKGILHRDIKPGNILITTQGLPVLADFGIAANIYQAKSRTGFSVPWAPPEILTGSGNGNESADIYSLGATLFATITGQSPYEYWYHPRNRDELAQIIVSNPVPALNRSDVPAEVERVLRKAMAKDPDDRYGSALEFARALQRAQHTCYGHTTPATVEGTAEFAPDLRQNTLIQSAQDEQSGAQHGSHRKTAIAVGGILAAAAAIVLVFVFVILPNLDTSSTRNTTAIGAPTPAPGMSSSTGSGTPGVDTAYIPTPTSLTGSYRGSTVTFTWTNPGPQNGDTYAWAPLQNDAANTGIHTQISTQPSVTITGVTSAQTCIQVSIVRLNRQMSQNPATACATR